MTTYKISVHTGPLSSENFATLAARVNNFAGLLVERCTTGTERLYFAIDAEDHVGAEVKAVDLLRYVGLGWLATGRSTIATRAISA